MKRRGERREREEGRRMEGGRGMRRGEGRKRGRREDKKYLCALQTVVKQVHGDSVWQYLHEIRQMIQNKERERQRIEHR